MGLFPRVNVHWTNRQLLTAIALDLNGQPSVSFFEEGMDGFRHGERVPTASSDVHLLLHQAHLGRVVRVLEVEFYTDFPPAHLLYDLGQLQVKPQIGLEDEQVLIAFVRNGKRESDSRCRRVICGRKQTKLEKKKKNSS